MPNRTFITEEDIKLYQDSKLRRIGKNSGSVQLNNIISQYNLILFRYTLLLCANYSGTIKCKPMLVYKSENPRVMKYKNKALLPVFWKLNKSAWVTQKNFQEWFQISFIPEVSAKLTQENLAFKVLFIMDDSSFFIIANIAPKCWSHVFTSKHNVAYPSNGSNGHFNFQSILSKTRYEKNVRSCEQNIRK